MKFKNVVFMVHKITSQIRFKRTIEMINRMYRFVSIEEIDSYFYGNRRLKNVCHISFDDGDRSIYEHAYPVLKAMGIPASLFVSPRVIKQNCNYWFQEVDYITDRGGDILLKQAVSRMFQIQYSVIKKFRTSSLLKQLKLEAILSVINEVKKTHGLETNTKYNLTVDEVLELKKSNLFTIGAHTLRHPILRNENDQTAKQEIRASISELSEMLGEEVKYFAYPNGISRLDYGSREIEILKNLNVRLAFSADQGCFNKKSNPLSIYRVGIDLSKRNQTSLLNQVVLVPMWTSFKNTDSQLNRDIKERLEIKKNRIFENLGQKTTMLTER